jgi:nucleotide-binding universal stress UspA family protein
LVCVDTTTAPDVLATAARLAGSLGAELAVHHVIDSGKLEHYLASHPGTDAAEVVEAAGNRLSALTRDIAGMAGDLEIGISTGRPAEELAEIASRGGFDLVVVSTHDKEGRSLGSVASALVRHSPCDVLLLRDGRSAALRRVAVGVDFSETSRVALERAVAIAKPLGASLDIIHVIYPPELDFYGGAFEADTVAARSQDLASAKQRAREEVERFLEPLHDALAGVATGISVLSSRFPGIAITAHLAESGIDLVVIGTTGRTRLLGLRIGSNAERLVRDTPCSVLAVKRR